jgi:hypothetical protein
MRFEVFDVVGSHSCRELLRPIKEQCSHELAKIGAKEALCLQKHGTTGNRLDCSLKPHLN